MTEPVDLINKKWFFKSDIVSPVFDIDHQQLYEIYVQHETPGQYYSVATGLTEELAKHIVDGHNAWYGFKSLSDGISKFFDAVNKSLEENKKKLEEIK